MTWGDSWGSSPCNNARWLAKAFYDGLERGSGKQSYVERPMRGWGQDAKRGKTLEYYYKGAVIARGTPPGLIPFLIAERLLDGEKFIEQPLEFRCHYGDKGEARHLRALGLEAAWQYGGRPFLIFGVEASGQGWHTIDEWKAMPKWIETPTVPKRRRVQFTNLTLPLFG